MKFRNIRHYKLLTKKQFIMKQIILIIALFATCAISSFAQNNNGDEDVIFNAKMKELQQKLALTSEQTVKVMPIYKSFNDEMRSLPRKKEYNTSTSDEAYKCVKDRLNHKMMILKIQEKYVGKLKDILTPEQLTKFLYVERGIQGKIMRERDKRLKHDMHNRHHRHGKLCPQSVPNN